VFEQSEDKGAISTFFNWFKQLAVHKRLNSADFVSLADAYRSAEEVQDMLQQTFEKWYQEGVEDGFEKGIEKGIEKGREEGIEKGREDALRRTALAMFARGIDPVLIADVTGLSADELNALLTSPPPQDDDA
jgi:predicted transposase/invertase (TIGR01784 family)